jgi:hypothetical protein
VAGDDKGDFLHNVAGDVQLVARLGGASLPVPTDAGFLKASLDQVWNDSRAEIADEFRGELGDEDDVRLDSLTLATAAQGELRVAERRDAVVLKYVVHQNTAQVTFKPAANASFGLTFDIELVLVLPRSQPSKALKVDRAVGFARHVELAGTGSFSNLAVELAKSFVRRKESSLSAKSREITGRINEELGELRAALLAQAGGGKVPPSLDNLDVDVARDGTLRVCLNGGPGQSCSFADVGRLNTARIVLERDGDSCGQGHLWLWDSEKGRFVDVRKGQQDVIVELNSPRFEWFCGDATEPNTQNDEWATAPNRTYGVSVSRKASGDDISWEFLDWRRARR